MYGAERRLQAATGSYDEGDAEPYVTEETLHQVHIFVFLIAACHVLNTVIVGLLGNYMVGRVWRRYAREKDRRLLGVQEILHVYNLRYMAKHINSKSLPGRHTTDSASLQDSARETPQPDTTIECLVRELNTATIASGSDSEAYNQPQL